MITARIFSGRSYIVLGLARSGAAAVEMLLASGARVVAWDENDVVREPFVGLCDLADPLSLDLRGFDGVVLSPGIPLNSHPIKEHCESFGVPIIGDLELFSLARDELPAHQVVGVTGTNGKSTTVALLHHILSEANIPSVLVGNIGVPILSADPLDEGGVYVLELSSYQIDLTVSLDCDLALLLNITPDHLDRYDNDFKKYCASKIRMFEMQSSNSIAFFPTDLVSSFETANSLKPHGIAYELELDLSAMGLDRQEEWPSLNGPHNLQNAKAAISLANALKIPHEKIAKALKSFPGLPHRLQTIGVQDGVTYVNDSKATNSESSAYALASFPPDPAKNGGDPRIHWIVGGIQKEESLGPCERYFCNVRAAYTIGKSGPLISKLLEPYLLVEQSETLAKALEKARLRARPGELVLLSPACSSFDQFRDFEARGEHFQELINPILAAPKNIQLTNKKGRRHE